MSSSSSEQLAGSSSFMSQVDLGGLNEPHKLAKWFTKLPKYKNCYLKSINMTSTKKTNYSDINTIDINNCQLLSKFVYENQLSGKHLKYNFNETQFKSILEIIHEKNDDKIEYDYKQFKWIWDIIAISQSISSTNNANDIFKTSKKLHWISSTWDKFECIQQDEAYLNLKSPQIDSNFKEHEEIKQYNNVSHQSKLAKSPQNGTYDGNSIICKLSIENNKSQNLEINKTEQQTMKTGDDDIKLSISKQEDAYDAEYRSPTPTCDRNDQLDHHEPSEPIDDEYEEEHEEEHPLVDDIDTPKQQQHSHKKSKKKGNRVRLNTDSSSRTMESSSSSYDTPKDGSKIKYNEKRRKVNNEMYEPVAENDDVTDETYGSHRKITVKGKEVDPLPNGLKKGKCGSCVIL